MRPAVGEPMFAFGKPNCGVLKQVERVGPELQAEALLIGKVRESDTSTVCVPGA